MAAAKTTETKPPAPPRRWGWRLFLVFAGLVSLVWAAPTMVAHSPAVRWACHQASLHLHCRVHVGAVSLGWFSPVVLLNVEIRDAADRPFVEIPKVVGDRWLLSLLLNRDDVGSFRLENPNMEVVFAGDQSNLEVMLARWTRPRIDVTPGEGSGPSTLPKIHLEVVDGTLMVHDADTISTWPIRSISGSVLLFDDAGKTAQLDVHGAWHDGFEPGAFNFEARLEHVLEADWNATVKGRFSSFPFTLPTVLLRRYYPDASLAGSLQGECHILAAMKDGKPRFEFTGDITGNQLGLTSSFFSEQFYIEHLKAPCTIRLENQKIIAQQIELDSDFGKISVRGSLDLSKDGLAAFDQPGFDLALNLNLAMLAERLQNTLRLHPDLELTSGQLNATCTSQGKNNGVVWHAKLKATDVHGVRGTQTIAWAQPITLDLQVSNLTHGIPRIDQVKCSSRFLRVEGASAADQFTLTAEADLRQMAEPLAQLVDVDPTKFDGQATGSLVVRRGANNQFVAQGSGQLKQMNMTWFTSHPWQEDLVTAKFDARGSIDPNGRQRLEAASVEMKLGRDLVRAQLTEPISDLTAGPWGGLSIRMDGDLARWQQRARCWTNVLEPCRLAGQMNAQAKVWPTRQTMECASIDVQVNDFRCIGPGLSVQESSLNAQTIARWDLSSGGVELTKAQIACPTIQIQADKIDVQPKAMTLRGSATVVGDVARLRKWMQEPGQNPGEPMAGTLAGRLNWETTENRVIADANLTLKNFLYGEIANPTWREPEIRLAGRGSYDLPTALFHLEKINVVSAMLNAEAKGKIANLTTTRDVDLAGTLAYDLEKMEPHLRSLLGKDVKIVGQDVRNFRVAGALLPPSKSNMFAVSLAGSRLASPSVQFTELKGEAGLNWKSMKALGCDVGPAEVKAIVQVGWFQLYPIETTFNNGKLRFQPNLRFEPGPVELIILAGPVIENAKITSEMCASALGYVMPLLANVADVEGTVSLALEGGRIPLAAPATGEVKGTFILHSAKVALTPLIRELSDLLKTPPPTALVKACRVPFHMVNGKVHHSDLELVFPDFTLKSSGSVGLDGSLALVVETSIPPRLAAAAKLTATQAKQTIRIPIGGTLEHPRVDPHALESLTSTLGRSILENELNRLLQPRNTQ